MARDNFFAQNVDGLGHIEALINFDEDKFGLSQQGVSPWTISINDGSKDLGRIVGFEGDGATIIAMHGLKPDLTARRGAEITVFRVNDDLRAGAGWRGADCVRALAAEARLAREHVEEDATSIEQGL